MTDELSCSAAASTGCSDAGRAACRMSADLRPGYSAALLRRRPPQDGVLLHALQDRTLCGVRSPDARSCRVPGDHRAAATALSSPVPLGPASPSPRSPIFSGGGVEGGYDPADLQGIRPALGVGGVRTDGGDRRRLRRPQRGIGSGHYRSHYGLSACTAANGCFKKVNQKGETESYPTPEPGWSVEISLDLDMASAACPKCHILLVEASNNEEVNLTRPRTRRLHLARLRSATAREVKSTPARPHPTPTSTIRACRSRHPRETAAMKSSTRRPRNT